MTRSNSVATTATVRKDPLRSLLRSVITEADQTDAGASNNSLSPVRSRESMSQDKTTHEPAGSDDDSENELGGEPRSAMERGMGLYRMVAVCVFCEQFFHSNDSSSDTSETVHSLSYHFLFDKYSY